MQKCKILHIREAPLDKVRSSKGAGEVVIDCYSGDAHLNYVLFSRGVPDDLVRVTRPAHWTAARKSPAEIDVEISL